VHSFQTEEEKEEEEEEEEIKVNVKALGGSMVSSAPSGLTT
jgi:hypothetical protein